MLTNGAPQRSITATLALILSLSGGGALSSHSTARKEPKYLVSPLGRPVFLSADSQNYKVYRAYKNSLSTKPMAIPIGYRKRTHVSRFHQGVIDLC